MGFIPRAPQDFRLSSLIFQTSRQSGAAGVAVTDMCAVCFCFLPWFYTFFILHTHFVSLIILKVCSKDVVLPVAGAFFRSTLFPSSQLYINMHEYSKLWATSFFSNNSDRALGKTFAGVLSQLVGKGVKQWVIIVSRWQSCFFHMETNPEVCSFLHLDSVSYFIILFWP